MKMLSTICTIMFVIGMIASSALAQPCPDEECPSPYLCLNGEECVECIEDEDCGENEFCNDTYECELADQTLRLDIKPGSCKNPLNVRSKGVLPVILFGTEDFNVSTIDPDSLVLMREGVAGEAGILRYNTADVGAPPEGEICGCEDIDDELIDEDIDGDGFMDLLLKFRVPDLVKAFELDAVESKETILLTLMEITEDDTSILLGEDCVWIINKMKWWPELIEKIKKPKKPKNGDEE
jgi:hypothetical protein